MQQIRVRETLSFYCCVACGVFIVLIIYKPFLYFRYEVRFKLCFRTFINGRDKHVWSILLLTIKMKQILNCITLSNVTKNCRNQWNWSVTLCTAYFFLWFFPSFCVVTITIKAGHYIFLIKLIAFITLTLWLHRTYSFLLRIFCFIPVSLVCHVKLTCEDFSFLFYSFKIKQKRINCIIGENLNG